MNSGVHYFVCGTAANRRGFEYATPGSKPLPDNPASYLDIPPKNQTGESHMLSQVSMSGIQYVRYAKYRCINPSDEGTNRGAYVAVGFLLSQRMTLHAAARCIEQACIIYADVIGNLRGKNAFAPDFRLDRYEFPSLIQEPPTQGEVSSILLTDLLVQAMHGSGKFKSKGSKVTVVDQDYAEAGSADADIVYLSPNNKKPVYAGDRDRENLRRLAEQVLIASKHMTELHTQWKHHAQAATQNAATLMKSSGGISKLLADLEARSASVQALAIPEPEPQVKHAPQTARAMSSQHTGAAAPHRTTASHNQVVRDTPSLELEDDHYHPPPRRPRSKSRGRSGTGARLFSSSKITRYAITGTAVGTFVAAVTWLALLANRPNDEPRARPDEYVSDRAPSSGDETRWRERASDPSNVAKQRAALDVDEPKTPDTVDDLE